MSGLINTLASNTVFQKSNENDALRSFEDFCQNYLSTGDVKESDLMNMYSFFNHTIPKKNTKDRLIYDFTKLALKKHTLGKPKPVFLAKDNQMIKTSPHALYFEKRNISDGLYDDDYIFIGDDPIKFDLDRFLDIYFDQFADYLSGLVDDDFALIGKDKIIIDEFFFYFKMNDQYMAIPSEYYFIFKDRSSVKVNLFEDRMLVVNTPYDNSLFLIGLLDWEVCKYKLTGRD